MISARQIIEIIQGLPSNDSSMRFLISIANAAFKYGGLTPKQTDALQRLISQKQGQGVL